MSFVINRMNKTTYYNLESIQKAIERPEGVGLLTVSNHVSVLDSASFMPCIIPMSMQFSSRVVIGREFVQTS